MTVLATERLILRPWRVADAVVQRELWTERDARAPAHRRIDAGGHPTLEELEGRILSNAQPGLLAAELAATGEIIGYCGLVSADHGDGGEPELAYEFLRRQWGRGYATEAATAVIESARASGHRRLWATVRDWNTASRRVLEKVGFRETGSVEPDPVHGDLLLTVREL